jgi:hypothetical protein
MDTIITRLTISLPWSLSEELRTYAFNHRTSMSKVIQKALVEYFSKKPEYTKPIAKI